MNHRPSARKLVDPADKAEALTRGGLQRCGTGPSLPSRVGVVAFALHRCPGSRPSRVCDDRDNLPCAARGVIDPAAHHRAFVRSSGRGSRRHGRCRLCHVGRVFERRHCSHHKWRRQLQLGGGERCYKEGRTVALACRKRARGRRYRQWLDSDHAVRKRRACGLHRPIGPCQRAQTGAARNGSLAAAAATRLPLLDFFTE